MRKFCYYHTEEAKHWKCDNNEHSDCKSHGSRWWVITHWTLLEVFIFPLDIGQTMLRLKKQDIGLNSIKFRLNKVHVVCMILDGLYKLHNPCVVKVSFQYDAYGNFVSNDQVVLTITCQLMFRYDCKHLKDTENHSQLKTYLHENQFQQQHNGNLVITTC